MQLFTSATDENHDSDFSLIHSDSHFANAIVVPDAELLFTGTFHRSGLDLVLTGHDGRHHVIPGYFANEHPPALMTPSGAHLTPEIVDMLAGSPAPHEYAQAGAQSALPPDSIGKVQKVAGTVTVLRNGVSVAVNVGDVVYKSDVILTGADSKCGVTFPDGTALELLPNTRMALNEYNYDFHSTSNQALFTLIDGTFGFVAGKVAHSGEMKIGTPVATMGIRGTTGVVQHVSKDNATFGDETYSYSVYDDPGTTTSGWWDMFVQNTDGSESLITTVSQTGYVTFVTPQGAGLPPRVTTVPVTASQLNADQLILQDLFETYALGGPRSIGIPGSGDNPLLQLPPNFLPGLGGPTGPFAYNYQQAGLPILPPPQDPQGPVFPANSDIFIWPIGIGTWPTGGQWNQGFAPNAADDIVIIESGVVTYGLPLFTIFSLTINGPLQNGGLPQGELNVTGGELVVTNGLTIGGELLLDGDPPTFISYGPATIESGGKLIVKDSGSLVTFTPNPATPNAGVIVTNFGEVAAKDGGEVKFDDVFVFNEPAGVIKAKNGGTIEFVDGTSVFNDPGSINTDTGAKVAAGEIEAVGRGALVLFSGSTLDNGGIVAAKHGGTVEFLNAGIVTNDAGGPLNVGSDIENPAGRIEAIGCDLLVLFKDTNLANFGIVKAQDGGLITFRDGLVTNESSVVVGGVPSPVGLIEAIGRELGHRLQPQRSRQ